MSVVNDELSLSDPLNGRRHKRPCLMPSHGRARATAREIDKSGGFVEMLQVLNKIGN